MSRFAIIAIFALIAISLLVLFGYTLNGILKYHSVNAGVESAVLTNRQPDVLPEGSASLSDVSWFDKISKIDNSRYKPITNELYIHFDLVDTAEVSRKKFFKLSINKNDSYSLFCIKQTVLKMNLKYFFVNTKKNANIIIDTDDISTLHHLVDSLKGYNINSSFSEIWI